MKFLILIEDYNLFYSNYLKDNIFLNKKSYEFKLRYLLDKKYYQSDSLAKSLIDCHHQAEVVIPKCNLIQLSWAKENCLRLYFKWLMQKPIRSFKARVLKKNQDVYSSIHFEVLLQQVKNSQPDILYFYSNIFITEVQLEILKKYVRKIVLQWTCPLWDNSMKFPYHKFDLIVTAAIQLKEYFDKLSYNCLYLQQAFDDSILCHLNTKNYFKGDVVFIGNFSLGHYYRFEVLEFLLQNGVDLTIYGKGKDYIPKDSLVFKKLKEPIFGIDMYNEYRLYKMAIHAHTTGKEFDGIDWNKYAGAKRLFEITGVGTLLLTSDQENVKDLFEIGEQVITYKSKEDLYFKIKELLSDQHKIEFIANQGMKRTLKEHSFSQRVKILESTLINL